MRCAVEWIGCLYFTCLSPLVFDALSGEVVFREQWICLAQKPRMMRLVGVAATERRDSATNLVLLALRLAECAPTSLGPVCFNDIATFPWLQNLCSLLVLKDTRLGTL